MKSCWLNRENNDNLIVFFAGWSFDENPFKVFACEKYDVLFVYDYNDINSGFEDFEQIFSQYENRYLLTWSMGVYVAYKLRHIFKGFALKIAINGTVTPVDDECGIPVKMFELTLKHAGVGLGGKFYKNVFKTDDEYEMYLKNPVLRSIENRVSELESLYVNIKQEKVVCDKFYDYALISNFDKIIPTKNQINSHKQNGEKIMLLDYGHGPFYNFNSWSEIIELCK